MRKQQRVLQQQADAAVVGGDVDARRRVGQHPFADAHDTVVGPYQTRDHVQGRRLARAVRRQHGEHFARGDVEFDVYAAVFDDGPQRDVGHRPSPRIGAPGPQAPLPRPTTTTAATATSSSDSATAASASVSRCR